MRDIPKLCRICLDSSHGFRKIFEESSLSQNISDCDGYTMRLAEKIRYVTLLKVNPKDNLPQQICERCIVQLNVSYNFRKLALENDFKIRQQMIENGIPLESDESEATSETSISPTIVNASECEGTPTSDSSTTSKTKRPFVHRPIEVKVDPEQSPVTSSNSSGQSPVPTVNSSNQASEEPSPPFVVIYGAIDKEPSQQKPSKARKLSTTVPLSLKRLSTTNSDPVVQDTERSRCFLRSMRKNDEHNSIDAKKVAESSSVKKSNKRRKTIAKC